MFTKDDSAKTKGIATILLLFHHLFFRSWGYDIRLVLISEDTLRDLAVAARICVWIFCFISAYGVALLFSRKSEKKSIQSFVFDRWFSLMKGYWFVYLLTLIWMLIAGKKPLSVYNNSLLNLLLDMFAWSDFFQSPTLIGAWWYMCFAQLQVILLPALILLCRKVGGITAFFIVLIGAMALPGSIVSASGGDYLMYIYASLFGVLCIQYDFFGKLRQYKGLMSVVQWLLILGVVILGIAVRFAVVGGLFAYNSRNVNFVTYGVSAVGIASLVYLAKDKCKLIDNVLAFLGNHSGNIYLIHMILVKYFGRYVFATKTVPGVFLLLLLASSLLSVVIEMLKKTIRYDLLLNLVKDKLGALSRSEKVVATE